MAVNQQKFLGKTTTVQSANVAPQQQLIAAPADTAALQDISKSLTRILQLLTQQNTQVTNEANQERKNQEAARRKKIELGLEGTFDTVKNAAQAVVAPVKGILDQIIQFFVTLFLGKALLNLIDWFANPENQNKVRSIARFLKDWWPSLIAGYILFGTGFGRAVRTLVGIAARSVVLLGGVALRLTGAIAKAVGLKKAGTALSALGGGGGGLKGTLAKLVVGGAIAAGGAVIAKNMMGGGGEEAPQLEVPQAPALPMAEAFGGGLIDFKTMLAASGGQVDSKLGILTQLFGSGGFASLLHGVPGVVSGPKGIDKVPAMLTDGEFVMSRGAVQKFGVNTLESMNAAGGGTNKPKIVSRKIYAAGGGLIGGVDDLRAKYDAKHGAGAYDSEVERRKAQYAAEDAAKEAKKNRKPTYIESPYVKQLKERAKTQGTTSTLSVNGMRIPGGGALAQQLQGMQAPKLTAPKVNANIDPNAVAGSIQSGIMSTYKKLGARTTTDQQLNAEWNKKALEKQRPWWDKAGLFGGGSRVVQNEAAARNKRDQENKRKQQINQKARDEYDKILDNPNHPDFEKAWDDGKGYMQSLKKKYESQPQPQSQSQKPTSKPSQTTPASQKPKGPETSQQRLDRLSGAGKGKGAGGYGGLSFGGSKGKRFDAESKAQEAENMKRGGAMGQLGRTFGRMFGDKKVAEQDKASQARVKQSGAASIGRYYSSSDGKYYKDYAAADAAKKARQAKLGKTPPKQKSIGPTPKPAPKVISRPPAGGGMGGGRGGGAKPSIPPVPAGKGNSKTKKQLGIK